MEKSSQGGQSPPTRVVTPGSLTLFQSIPANVLDENGVTRTFTSGEFVFRQGEPTSGLWVIVEGRTAIERTGSDGLVYTTGIWQPGDIVGIAGIWDGSGYPATARTLDNPTRLFWMERERFLRLHRTLPDFGESVSRMLAARLRYIQELVSDTRGRPVAIQVAVILSTLSAREGLDVALTHEDLAHMVGTKRETVSRVLADFQRRGWVESGYRHIRIVNRDRLAAYVEAGADASDLPARPHRLPI
jgi:CRP-like cAMP-binding protein